MKSITAILVLLGIGLSAQADYDHKYKVTITNLTQGQVLSPPLLAIHDADFELFEIGQPASLGLALLAEDGATEALANHIMSNAMVQSLMSAENGIMPGKSMTYNLSTKEPKAVFSFASMLVTTNDAFTGISGNRLPEGRAVLRVKAYDAGSENNTESCEHIPGPPCGSHDARATMGAEGEVQHHPGILGVGDLDPSMYDWDGSTAKVTIEKVH